MKLFHYAKDGGVESRVAGWFIVEIKRLFSVVLLHFFPGSREAYHSHAFDAVSLVLKGKLVERLLDGRVHVYTPSLVPVVTRRTTFHKVVSVGDTWVLTLRGPWVAKWWEYLPDEKRLVTLTHGRQVVS